MQRGWADMVAAEGTVDPTNLQPLVADDSGELPCPACGTTAPLVDGACSDCGLVLE